jgi:hypothetical protein
MTKDDNDDNNNIIIIIIIIIIMYTYVCEEHEKCDCPTD